jgi:oxygen-independent coproporphyrinogen-3 oxidase
MWLEAFLKGQFKRFLTKENYIALESRIPLLEGRFQDIDEFGLYLHIPFCHQICPYCPYNKEIYHSEVAERYTKAVIEEIDIYSEMIGSKPVTSFYIGGGTPTTMLYSGLDKILDHIFEVFNVQCDIHMESHPNDLSSDNLSTIISMGVQHLSTGVEALQDKHLKTLNRPYTVEKVKAAVERAVSRGFKCVNVDVIFALPGQTYREIEQTGHALVEMGVDQVAAYPLQLTLFSGFLTPKWEGLLRETTTKAPASSGEERCSESSRGSFMMQDLKEPLCGLSPSQEFQSIVL